MEFIYFLIDLKTNCRTTPVTIFSHTNVETKEAGLRRSRQKLIQISGACVCLTQYFKRRIAINRVHDQLIGCNPIDFSMYVTDTSHRVLAFSRIGHYIAQQPVGFLGLESSEARTE